MGLRKLWKRWRIRDCSAGLAVCEEALSSVQGALVDHEGRLEMYRRNPLLGEAKWREFHEYCRGRAAYWAARTQEWTAREENAKRQYVFLAVSFFAAALSVLWGAVC